MYSEEIISLVKERVSKFEEIIAVYLFGSFLSSEEYEDIDIGILLDDTFEPNYMYEIKIQRILEKLLRAKLDVHKTVDIHILNHQNVRFLYGILGNSKLILSKNETKRAKFEARVITHYLDMKPFYEYFDNMRRLRYGHR
ncbi:MAG: nucleotidyltransferase domain-containing protein [Promethearchaeia archaeon]